MSRYLLDQYVVRAEHSPAALSLFLYIFDVDNKPVSAEVTFTEVPPGTAVDPAVRIPEERIQVLVDDLWRAGFRPSEDTTAGQAQAMKDHIGDLRLTVKSLFGLVEVETANRIASEGGE